MLVIGIGLLVQILLNAQVSKERNTITTFDDMVALDVFLHHMNFGIQGLEDK